MAASARDATYVLDGLLSHESDLRMEEHNTDLRIEEHHTDTAGFTDHVFALCHLPGFRLVIWPTKDFMPGATLVAFQYSRRPHD